MGRAIDLAIRELDPGYFALVMATGIVSIAMHLLGWPWLANALLAFNCAAYGGLWLLTLVRLARHPAYFAADLDSTARSFEFLTLVAATGVVGSQWVIIGAARTVGVWLWVLGSVLWFGLTYLVVSVDTVRRNKPSLPSGLNGGWLLTTVGTQAVSILTVLVAPALPFPREALFFGLVLYLLGWTIYVLIITLIFYRLLFSPFSAAAMSPLYWINMGAMAITALAGSTLVPEMERTGFVAQVSPFVGGLTLLAWGTASWWVPLLVLLEIWRHAIEHFPIVYDPRYWGLVFPLGMYATATDSLAHTFELPFLEPVASFFGMVSLVAWIVTTIAWLWRIRARLTGRYVGGSPAGQMAP